MKILIAVDGSKHTRKALDYLAKHRASLVDGHELVLVNVCSGIPPHAARHVSKDVLDSYYAEETGKVIEPVKLGLAERNISGYTIDVRHGNAAEEILKSANAAKADLIVMGTHGHGIFGRALMGSVATKVVAETDISVLLVQ
ncbi:universal stress protein [Variovorax sp. J22G21]|uniref:universal stress protein n=1 Tax=Variovorax fucosicus TaxID=3053517 RepID=UPI002575EA6F|nr:MULTISPECIES: universal stress protein [unclassified Variovorax]MDM0040861.1 universal stress protein [Variovorax sp. J22R193]MDM0057232.1 universal stress protein [Variovorax sp. J22G47]MDM0059918.1 universal stress protein [Variovorax sp. J22G21]